MMKNIYGTKTLPYLLSEFLRPSLRSDMAMT